MKATEAMDTTCRSMEKVLRMGAMSEKFLIKQHQKQGVLPTIASSTEVIQVEDNFDNKENDEAEIMWEVLIHGMGYNCRYYTQSGSVCREAEEEDRGWEGGGEIIARGGGT